MACANQNFLLHAGLCFGISCLVECIFVQKESSPFDLETLNTDCIANSCAFQKNVYRKILFNFSLK